MKKIHSYLLTALLSTVITTAVVCPITVLLCKTNRYEDEDLRMFPENIGNNPSDPKSDSEFTKNDIIFYGKKAKSFHQTILNEITFNDKLESWEASEKAISNALNNYKEDTSMEKINSLICLASGKQPTVLYPQLNLKRFSEYLQYSLENYNEMKIIYHVDYLYVRNNCIFINKISLFYAKKVKKPFNNDKIIVYETTKATRLNMPIFKFKLNKIPNFEPKNIKTDEFNA